MLEPGTQDQAIEQAYEGNFEHDLRQGKGKMWYKDGSWYEGSWNQDMRHGDGKYFYAKLNATYIGSWMNNLKSGAGEVCFSNSDLL